VKFEPSETMKLALIAATARLLKHRKDLRTWRGFCAPFLLAALPLALILSQPDLGSTMILSAAVLAMVFAAGARLRHFAVAFGPLVVGFPLVYRFALKAHQQRRIDTFLGAFDGLQRPLEMLGFHPTPDVRHAGYQLAQAMNAIGSGGMWGQGWCEGAQTQLHAVPEAHTDFIFSVIGEEGGFVMTFLTVTVLFAVVLGCLETAWRTREPFGRFLAVGFGALFAAQVVVNAGMTIGLAPVTGITLPFVSYGGSSLLTCFIALGLVNGVGMRHVHELGSQS
jgi:rod shape determining protein RodA